MGEYFYCLPFLFLATVFGTTFFYGTLLTENRARKPMIQDLLYAVQMDSGENEVDAVYGGSICSIWR